MTTTAAAGFTVGSQSSRPYSLAWNSTTNLLNSSPGTYSGPGTIYKGAGTYIARLSVPSFITSLDDGSEFESLKVTFKAKSSSLNRTYYAKLTDGTLFDGTVTTSYQTFTLDGDASYWGLSSMTDHQIFDGLKDGSIKFNIYITGSVGETLYLKEVEATLTYKEADTARAAIITTIP